MNGISLRINGFFFYRLNFWKKHILFISSVTVLGQTNGSFYKYFEVFYCETTTMRKSKYVLDNKHVMCRKKISNHQNLVILFLKVLEKMRQSAVTIETQIRFIHFAHLI